MRSTRTSGIASRLVSRTVRAAVWTLTVGASCLLITGTAFADDDDSGDPPQYACVTGPGGSCNGQAKPSDASSSDETPTAKQVCRAWEEQGAITFNQKDQNWCRYVPGN